jgi:superfamily II DNA helicase RecQ
VDFIQDVAPLAISLREKGLQSCSYHGDKMTVHDKIVALENWKIGKVQLMVCLVHLGWGLINLT